MKSIDGDCEEVSDETASNIARGSKNPSGYLMDALGNLTADSYKSITAFFQDKIVPLIKENERNNVRDTLIMMIQEADEIDDDTVVDVINGIKKSDIVDVENLASLLSGCFLYALKNTKNNIGGSAKRLTKKYYARVKKGEKPGKKIAAFGQGVKESKLEVEPKHYHFDYRSRELELMEERIEQEAVAFCIKYEGKRQLIPLCQIAFITNPMKKHAREMYNEFCLCTASTRNRILEKNNIERLDISEKGWWRKYLEYFKKDYEKYNLGDKRYLYAFGQYFDRLINYGNKSIKPFSKHVISPKIITPIIKAFPNHKYNIIDFIDEYICYGSYDEYMEKLEPPMNFLWRELNLSDSQVCSEFMLASILALFIIGTCLNISSPNVLDAEESVFSAPGTSSLETAEDLFYDTLLILYNNYERG